MRIFQFIAAATLLSLLAACGGGGSSGTPTQPVTPQPVVVIDPNLTVPLQTAMANLVNNGFSLPYIWSYAGQTGSGTLTMGTPTSVTFTSGVLSGTVALKSVVINGTSSAITYFNPADYTILAKQVGTRSYLCTPYSMPSTVKAGDTGTLGSCTTGGLFADTTSGVYSVASDRADSLLASYIETEKISLGTTTITSTKYRISTAGSITIISITSEYHPSFDPPYTVVYTF